MFYVTDLDGTLLRKDLSVSQFTRDTFNALLREGIKLTYATSRSFNKSSSLLSGIDFVLPCIVLNGALILDPRTGKILIANLLKFEIAEELLSLGRKLNLNPFILGRSQGREVVLHAEPSNPGQVSFLEKRKGDPRLAFTTNLRPIDETLVLNFISTEKVLEPLRAAIVDAYGEQLNVQFMSDVYCDGYHTLEILDAKADKAKALEQVAGWLNEDLKDVVVFGDHLNDLSMFRAAGRGIAVSNAHTDLKQAAALVIGSNEEDAVAHFLANASSSKGRQ